MENDEGVVRIGFFIATFLVMAVLEWRWPRRLAEPDHRLRWITNLSLAAINTVLLRVVFFAGAAVVVALWVQERGWGLLNQFESPLIVTVVGSVIVLDALIYAAHRAFHQVPWLWRVHRVHHTDQHMDVTTGIRFHPIEIILSMTFKIGVVAVLGLPPEGILVYEVILSAFSLFNHANMNLPVALDQLIRIVVVTPDMHRVHHSVRAKETNSNYGNFLSCWDRWFGSYCSEPRDGQSTMAIGLGKWRDRRPVMLWWNLVMPFLRR